MRHTHRNEVDNLPFPALADVRNPMDILNLPESHMISLMVDAAEDTSGSIRGRPWAATLVFLLGHPNGYVRLTAAETLGACGFRSTWRALAGVALSDPEFLPRVEAVDSLRVFGVKASCRSLQLVAQRDTMWVARGRAMIAVARILGKPALPWMEATYQADRSPLARRYMAFAFLEVGDTSKMRDSMHISKRMGRWYLPDFIDWTIAHIDENEGLDEEQRNYLRTLLS